MVEKEKVVADSYQNTITEDDGIKAVCNDDDRVQGKDLPNGRLNELVCVKVQRSGRFVHHHQTSMLLPRLLLLLPLLRFLLKHNSRQTEELLLPEAHLLRVDADGSVQASTISIKGRKSFLHHTLQLNLLQDGPKLLISKAVGAKKVKVLTDGATKDDRILRNDGDRPAKLPQRVRLYAPSVEANISRMIVEAEKVVE